MQKTICIILAAILLSGCIDNIGTREPTSEQLYSQPKTIIFNYTVDGEPGTLRFTAYRGLSEYLQEQPRTFYCSSKCPSNSSIQQTFLDEKKQRVELERFAQAIDNITSSPEKRRKIAISIIQNIPYDDALYQAGTAIERYPYQVIYDSTGVCGEKARLLAYVLRHQGYATALLNYHHEKHAALGVKCPAQYSTKNTGYCFIETTSPAIPTFDQGIYPGFGKLSTSPEIITLSNGTEYYPVQDYLDAREWTRLQTQSTQSGGYLEQKDFDKWVILKDKYGMRIE